MGQERRAYPRRPVHWEATVTGDGLTEQPMTIRDFCAGGLFLEYPVGGQLRPPTEALPETIRVRFQDPSSGASCECEAHLVRDASTGLAVSFDGPRLDVVTILSAVAQGQSEAHRGHLAEAAGDELARDVLEICRRRAIAFVERVLPVFAGYAIEELARLAREMPNQKDRDAVYDCHRALQYRENDMIASFVAQLTERIDDMREPVAPAEPEPGDSPLPESIDELELVDTNDFENWLNRSEIVNQAESRFAGELERLTRRLGYVVGHQLDEQSNPLGPAAMSETLADSLPLKQPPTQVSRTLYRSFGRHVLDQLGELYSVLNEALRERSILPGLESERPEIRSLGGSQRGQWVRRAQLDTVGPGGGLFTDSGGSNRPAQLLAERLRTASATPLVPVGEAGANVPAEARQADAGATGDAAAGASSARSPSQEASDNTLIEAGANETREDNPPRWLGLQQTLRSAREAAAQRPAAPSPDPSPTPAQDHAQDDRPAGTQGQPSVGSPEPANTLDTLLGVLDVGRLEHLPEALRDRIEVIAEWFEDIATNPINPALLRDWCRPLARLALERERQAEEFLSDTRYPIHDLLDQWDRAALALTAIPEDHRAGLQQRLERLLDWVCESHVQQPNTIADAASQISALVDAPLEARAANFQRITEQYEGSKRLEQARSHVGRALDERLSGRRIPAPLHEFFRDYWHNILVLVRLRSGPRSEHWQRALAVVDRLVMVMGTDDQSPRAVPDYHKVFAFIDKQLTAFGRHSSDSETLLGQMKARAEAICQGREPSEPVTLVRVTPFSPVDDEHEDGDPYWLGLAKLLRPGQWLGEAASGGQTRALRLQWCDDARSRYIFADHTGTQPVVHQRHELADGLAQGSLWLTADLDASLTQRQWHRKIEASHKAVIELATHDARTSLLNRKALVRELQRLEERYRSSRQSHALLCFHFADLADVGDETTENANTVRAIADRLTVDRHPNDRVGRTDTDSFVVFLAERTTARAEVVAEEIRRDLEPEASGGATSSRVSVGLIGFQFGGLQSTMQLLRDAEEACAEVMVSGGGRVATIRADERDLPALRENMQRAAQLDAALEAGNLQLRAQRIQSISHRGPTPHPLREILIAVGSGEDTEQLLSPAQFIPAAERFGRMASVDRWVIRNVLEWCRDNPRQAAGAKAFTINLAAATLHDTELIDYLHAEFARTGIAPDKICFELSETVAVQNLSRAADLVTGIRQLGCHFALDDVGTGENAHDYLANLPVDYIKIDGGFIRHIATDETDAAMVGSINALAHHLGKITIAEYVENEAILTKLETIGVDYVQGYGIGYPEPLSKLPLV